ncbi:hypothetical protein DMC30DRAFT_137862 [Rhodotorula diobovata]|uniref:Uncharacterized protein n=1 Tax=Rhodotorula diobovata TaxID=5288 RepID=A0A5C5FMI1_9BASI|nr:hypothetical protein DMC30DRAFT_137862 [Rhodotorula diobovata]
MCDEVKAARTCVSSAPVPPPSLKSCLDFFPPVSLEDGCIGSPSLLCPVPCGHRALHQHRRCLEAAARLRHRRRKRHRRQPQGRARRCRRLTERLKTELATAETHLGWQLQRAAEEEQHATKMRLREEKRQRAAEAQRLAAEVQSQAEDQHEDSERQVEVEGVEEERKRAEVLRKREDRKRKKLQRAAEKAQKDNARVVKGGSKRNKVKGPLFQAAVKDADEAQAGDVSRHW